MEVLIIMKVFFCVIIIATSLIAICVITSCSFATITTYGVLFRNIGENNLYVSTRGVIGNYEPPVGVLNSGFERSSGNHIGIPYLVTVIMKRNHGTIIERTVKVKENIPSRFGNNDTIVFNINDNDEIILSFKRWGAEEIDSDGNPFDLGKIKSKAAVE